MDRRLSKSLGKMIRVEPRPSNDVVNGDVQSVFQGNWNMPASPQL